MQKNKTMEEQLNIYLEQAYECGWENHDKLHLLSLLNRTKHALSQERKQWKADLREKIKNMEVTNFDISGDMLLERRISGYNNALSDMLSLLASPDGPGAGKEEYE